MFRQRSPALRGLFAPFTRWSKESIAIYSAIAFLPIMIAVGAAVDYLRAENYKAEMQAALDAAILSGGRDGSADWTQTALNTFNTKLSSKYVPLPKPTFVLDPSTGNYSGTVMGSQPTSILGIINISSINVTVTATAVAYDDNAFILALDHAPPKSHVWIVNRLSGDAFLTNSAGQQAALSEGAILNPGNIIRTGQYGRVLLVRGQETILIASNSAIGISTDVTKGISTTINQWAGSILLAVEKRNEKHFEVITPYLAAVVKGTRFRVTVNKDDTSVEVLRGQVEIADFKSGQYALVLPGQMAKVFAQGPADLSLSGSGTLSPILRGPPRKSSVNPVVLSMPPSTERTSQRENSSDSGSDRLRRFFGHADDGGRSENENVTFAIAFACGVGVVVAFIVAVRRRRRRWE